LVEDTELLALSIDIIIFAVIVNGMDKLTDLFRTVSGV